MAEFFVSRQNFEEFRNSEVANIDFKTFGIFKFQIAYYESI